MRNLNLDTIGVCPNKVAIDGVIRDSLEPDPLEEDIPPPSPSFGTNGYQSSRDEEFPYYKGETGPPDIPVPAFREIHNGDELGEDAAGALDED